MDYPAVRIGRGRLDVSESLLVKAYSIPHSLDVKNFVDDYLAEQCFGQFMADD